MRDSSSTPEAGLAPTVPVYRYVPERVRFRWREWDPALVQSPQDLPPYLILGGLDAASFSRSADGWSARWQGLDSDSHLGVAYRRDVGLWEVRQTWRGLEGGVAVCPASRPLEEVIACVLNATFPRNWASAARQHLEAAYHITYIEQPNHVSYVFGIPDGALRTIAFPIPPHALRQAGQWLHDSIGGSNLTYPVVAEARPAVQIIHYADGEAGMSETPSRPTGEPMVHEMGLFAPAEPVREVMQDGSVVWTRRRHVYCVLIGVPFAGLTDLLGRLARADGPIRSRVDTSPRFEERPWVLPAGIEIQARSMGLSDNRRTTRSTLQFAAPDHVRRP